jgi:hypothetical protein
MAKTGIRKAKIDSSIPLWFKDMTDRVEGGSRMFL